MKKYDVSVIGATGLVGQTFLKILAEEHFPIKNLYLYSGQKSAGTKITFDGKEHIVEPIKKYIPNKGFSILATDAESSKKFIEEYSRSSGTIIDNSSAYRMDKDVPLVIPEINLGLAYNKKIISNPNCTTAICALPVYLLYERFGIERIRLSTYQSVSGNGKQGLWALDGLKSDVYPYDIRKTCIPQIGCVDEEGYTEEENKIKNELRKIFEQNSLPVSATCVRVPIKFCHAVSVSLVLKKEFNIEDVTSVLKTSNEIEICNEQNSPYPVATKAYASNKVYIGRLRKDQAEKNGLLFYVLSDNLRRGAAYNAFKIMKGLAEINERI